jgi:hypothetical protein
LRIKEQKTRLILHEHDDDDDDDGDDYGDDYGGCGGGDDDDDDDDPVDIFEMKLRTLWYIKRRST